ncbi:hypothetical protein M378DRAFT_167680 [Amanita muscaria Koide BX008]|uniref:Uncharacterized protein n=1 Tax=Amanita muscaria (strain Koide BX008) TaxID=946122 RepID=A0A0C2SCY8_AMAMK|nr:hypothetical protein M378DRAFT_167680 [Amanita muscaria Koide BX008]
MSLHRKSEISSVAMRCYERPHDAAQETGVMVKDARPLGSFVAVDAPWSPPSAPAVLTASEVDMCFESRLLTELSAAGVGSKEMIVVGLRDGVTCDLVHLAFVSRHRSHLQRRRDTSSERREYPTCDKRLRRSDGSVSCQDARVDGSMICKCGGGCRNLSEDIVA